MGGKSKAQFEKRRKELARQEKQKEKRARKLEAKERKTEDGAVDEDIEGIVLGPQPPPEESEPE